MNFKKIIILALGLALVVTGLFFHSDIKNLYLKYRTKLNDIRGQAADTVSNSLEKAVYAPPPLKSEDNSAMGALSQAGTLHWTNIERENNGQKDLAENSKLDHAAASKAQDILKNQYFEHISPSGVGPSELDTQAGYQYLMVGENLALGGFENDQKLLEAWMGSPGHRENILNPGFREIGVAVLKGIYQGNLAWVAVQEFGTPESVCLSVDANLKATIDANQAQIVEMTKNLDVLRTQIEKINPSKDPGYNKLVSQYNDLANAHNNLAETTKSLVDKYNGQINEYNACIKKYTGQ